MRISQIIDKINEQHLFVPAFQREYVWKREDAKNLIHSLIQDYPTGTMLTWETMNPPELKGDYIYNITKGSVKLILDGQQRITTLYMLITGKIPPYYTRKEIQHDIRELYVNVESLALEYYKKNFMENDPTWVDITDIFKGEVRTRDIVDRLEEKNNGERLPRERENKIDDNFEAIKRIPEREFLEQVIPAKASVKEAIDIFYIVNSSGVSLTDAELALAQISGYWPTAREEFKRKLDQLKSTGWNFSLDFIVYVLLATVHRQGSKMEKLHTPDNNEKLQEAWKKLSNTVLDYTFSILRSHAYVDHTDEINSVYALIPIITYIYLKPDHKLNEEEIKKVIKWFYYSQIRTRYTGQMQQKLDKDLKVVEESESPFDELLKIIEEDRSLEIKPTEFSGRTIRHPLFSLMRWYFKSMNAICLGTGIQLRQNMGAKYQLENDHIFAYSILRDSDHFDMDNRMHYALAQEMTNRAILTQNENRRKSARYAGVYLKEVQRKFPNALALQCIPEDEVLWRVENYEEFIKVRRSLLADRLNHFLNNITVTPEDIKVKLDLKEIINEGESSILEFKSTLRWNIRESRHDKKMEEVIMKSIVAFANGEGGKLLIGVADDGEILGLQNDYNTLKNADKDYFELHLRNLINHAFGKDFASAHLTINFPVIDEKEICEINIKASRKPVFLEVTNKNGQKLKKFYVRSGNSSQDMDIAETTRYIEERFERG